MLIVFTVGLAYGSIREQTTCEANVGAEIYIRALGSLGMSGSYGFRLDAAVTDELLQIPAVKDAVAIGQKSVTAEDNNTGKRLVDGIILERYAPMAGLTIVEGRAFTPGTDEAIIDTGWQAQKGYKVGDTLDIYDRKFTIVGTYQPAGGARIKLPLDVMQDQLGSEGKISSVLVSVKEGFTIDQVGQNILNRFPDNQIIRTSDLEELYMSGFPALNVFLNVFIGIAAAISALVILLTMYTTVTERTRQIGIMKSLGMSSGKIAWTITQEALLISFFGIICGIILTIVVRWLLTFVTTLSVEISPLVVLTVFVVGLIGGAVGGLYPALRAAKLDAVEALSYE